MTNEIIADFTETGIYDRSARLARLTVLHNPHAAHRLGFDVLNGPHDIQWAQIEVDSERGYGIVCEGVRIHEVAPSQGR